MSEPVSVLADFWRRPRSNGAPTGHLDTAQVAALLELSPERVRVVVQAGKLPAKRIRNKWWYARQSVAPFVASKPRLVDPIADLDLHGQEV
jgi:hypothetical protein